MAMKRLVDFVPARLTQARLAKGLMMSELALRLNPILTRQAISSFEKGTSNPSPETLRALANELDVSASFLTSPLRPREADEAFESAITFRTLASSSKRLRAQAAVYLKWLAGLGQFIEQHIEMPNVALPDFAINDFTSLDDDQIADIAAKCRKLFGLGDGPISDLTLLLENKGVFIGYVTLGTGMDGISAWVDGRPVILISEKAYAARARFDMAHELGHLILHHSLTGDELEAKGMLPLIEKQAQCFASCFLMPENTFASEIYAIDEESLVTAKKRWGVSMQAILMRLNNIGLISDHQKIRAFQIISSKGQRKKEPLDGVTEPERARLFKKAVEFLSENNVLSINEFFDYAKYPTRFLELVTGMQNAITEPSNVIAFRFKAAN